MSRILLNKIDIDVLVQLALLGPGDVDRWKAPTDPDHTGATVPGHTRTAMIGQVRAVDYAGGPP